MMKLLLVVLSMLYGANAQSVSGCNSDIIESLGLRRTASLASFFPRSYFAALTPFLVQGIDSATQIVGLPVNSKSYTTIIQCIDGAVAIKVPLVYTQKTETRIEGVGFPTADSTLDYYPVECTDGLILTYICDPTQVRGSGTETFVIVTRTSEPVETDAFEACKARAQEVYSEVEFTTVTVGAC